MRSDLRIKHVVEEGRILLPDLVLLVDDFGLHSLFALVTLCVNCGWLANVLDVEW
jgi:hypothetical protein